MERSREVRKGTVAVVNGGGLSRRRHRSTSLRDSPEEDGSVEMTETTVRLRERTCKKERDRDRERSSSRSKRRRGERMIHGSMAGKEEGEESSDESWDDYDEEEEEDNNGSVSVRLLPPATAPAGMSSPASAAVAQSHHMRKGFPPKVVRPPLVLRADDEMIGVPIPRRARSASGKRSQDSWVSGGGGGGGAGEQIHRQQFTSPATPSLAPNPPISPPSSSNASVRKKIKAISGTKQRPPRSLKPSSSVQDIEIEVAEVLFGLTRQFQSKQETHKHEIKDGNGSSNDAKSRVSSPISIAPSSGGSQPLAPPVSNLISNSASLHAIAQRKKRPRPVKFDDESPASPTCTSAAVPTMSASSAAKVETEQPVKTEASSPKSENTTTMAVDNGGVPMEVGLQKAASKSTDVHPDAAKPENRSALDGRDPMEKETYPAGLDVNLDEAPLKKAYKLSDRPREEKFSIDLMAPPPGKSSPERDGFPDIVGDQKSSNLAIDLKVYAAKKEEEKVEAEHDIRENFVAKKQIGKERTPDLRLDLEQSKDGFVGAKQQIHKQTSKAALKPEKSEKLGPPTPVSLPVAVSGWPGSIPPAFGYMGQVPSLPASLPIDGSSASSKVIQPPNCLAPQPRPKRCATHCYIAKNIYYHQQFAKMNPFWPAAAGSIPMYGAKSYNLNTAAVPVPTPVPALESSIIGNPMQGRSLGSLHNKGVLAGHSTKEKSSPAPNMLPDTSQRKQHIAFQQLPPPGSANNMLHGPAFIFPLGQQPGGAATASRGLAPKSNAGIVNATATTTAGNSGVASSGTGAPATSMNFNYSSLPPNEAQYLAILQNNAYPFPIPTHVGGSPTFRGATPAQAMSFFNGSFYSSQMLHPSHLHHQQQQTATHQQTSHGQHLHGHQNTSTSSGSSSSQKHPPQSQQIVGGEAAATASGMSSHRFPSSKQQQHLVQPHQARQFENERGCEDSPSTADSRVSQAQKSIYGHNFAMPIHPPNFALISPAAAAAAIGGGGSQNEKPPSSQQQTMKLELTPSQAFAMSFASFGGASGAGTPSGLDFSSMAQNHTLFQNLPEAARHGYQISAAAVAAQAAQHMKKAMEDGKHLNVAGDEDRKMMAAGKQSLNFSRSDTNAPVSSILANSTINGSSRTLNLIPSTGDGGGSSSHAGSAALASSGAATVSVTAPSSQQQQQLIQLQKQQQQQQLQHQLASRTKTSASSNNTNIYSDRLSAGSAVTKFSQSLTGFPQALMQSGSPTQSPQWKASARAAGTAPSPHVSSSSVKNHLPQQQGRASQQSIPSPIHQTQISFGISPLKMGAPNQQLHVAGSGMPSSSSASNTIVVGSPPNSISKGSTGSGSPRASTCAKPGQSSTTTLPVLQQMSAKHPSSTSSRKSSPVSNRTGSSILGHPHSNPASGLSGTKQQQPHQQGQQKQSFQQAQLFFSNTYMPAQSSQSNAAAAAAAAAAYYHRRPSDQQPQQQGQQQQHHSMAGSTGMLSLCSSALSLPGATGTSDALKATTAANSIKGLPPASLLQHPAANAFPYIHAMPSVSAKLAEQKPAAA